MTKAEKYYFIRIELSNGKTLYKSDVKSTEPCYAWEEAYDEEDSNTISIIDDIGNYYILTRSHIVQVVVQESDAPENIDGDNKISF